ncbi:glycoside hydrolase family 97 C-terminal domain-containing protein [Sunxiuqinia rutila]|uniref:glycoside hydrolase family 97 C-terminal domain-containing protein n=1 Tax=Sunxiuqinia rutila TaxID=1397841 RepID=UPI003D36A51D
MPAKDLSVNTKASESLTGVCAKAAIDFIQRNKSVWKDGVNADKHAADFAQESQDVNSASKVNVKMAPGGGWTAIIKKK